MSPRDGANMATLTEAADILSVSRAVLKNAVGNGALDCEFKTLPANVRWGKQQMMRQRVINLEDAEAYLSVKRVYKRKRKT